MLHEETNGTFKSFFSSLVEYMIQLFLLKIATVTLRNVIAAKTKCSIKAKCNNIDGTCNNATLTQNLISLTQHVMKLTQNVLKLTQNVIHCQSKIINVLAYALCMGLNRALQLWSTEHEFETRWNAEFFSGLHDLTCSLQLLKLRLHMRWPHFYAFAKCK